MQRGRARGSGGYRYQQQQQMTLQDLQRIQQYEEEKKNQPQGASRFNLAAGNYYPKQSYQNIMQNNIPLDIGNVINMLSQELNNNSQNYDQQVPTWSNRNQNDTFYNQQPVPSYQQNQTNFQPKSGFGTVSQSKNNESHHSIQQSPTTQEQISENETFRGGRGSRGTRGDRGDRGGYRGRAERRGFDNNNTRGTQPFNRGRGRGNENTQADQSLSQPQFKENKTKTRYFSNPDLESIKLSEPAKIVDNLLNTKDLSASIDATNYSTRGYSLFIYIWHKIYFDKNVQQTELNIISSAFLESQFFNKFSTQYVPELNQIIRSMNDIRLRLDDLKLVFELLLSLIDKFKSKIHKLPISAISTFIMDDVTLILDLYDPLDLYASFVGELQVMALKLKEKKMQYMKETQEEQKQIEEKKKKSKAMREDLNLIIQPPDDFQDIDVIPTFHELQKDGIPFLRKMPTEGVFQNTHYYLDVVYRLLREDAIRPLREGISVMSKQQNLGQIQDQSNYQIQKKLNRDLRDAGVKLYDEVALYNLTITRNSPDIAITLRIFEKGKSNWMTSKKLLPGSLVIISKDEFKSFDFFLVSERNGKQMTETSKKFKFIDIQIQLITGDDAAYQQNLDIQDFDLEYLKWDANKQSPVLQYFLNHRNSRLKMIESTAYFESYYHVLKKIKQMDKWDYVPFEEYLTGHNKDFIRLPAIYEELEEYQQVQFNQKIVEGINTAKLDNNQAKAMNACLKKELALIQGPPGTGKTYVGEHFVKILIDNKKFWRENKGPILIVCYTNHALDQFLNLISKYTMNFVRIGGRSQDESLKNHSIQQYIKDRKISYPKSYSQIIQDIESLTNKISNRNYQLQLNQLGLVNCLSKQQGVNDLLLQITREFNRVLKQSLEYAFEGYQKKDYTKALQHFTETLLVEPDLPVLFWLGLIDLDKYIQDLIPQIVLSQQHQMFEQDLYYNLDDLNQREKEYEEILDQKDIYYSKSDAQYYEKKYFNLTQLYKQQTQSDFFFKQGNMMQCIQRGQQIGKAGKLVERDYPLFNLRMERRWQLNNYYADNQDISQFQELHQLIEEYKIKFQRRQELQSIVTCKALKQADIVAMTTTGCAKNSDMMKDINFPIVIVEEAAEVFEAHILTALSQKTEHLILIGDHQQLRPSPAVYELEKTYNLDMSMFERLVKNKFEYTTLSNQRRMRPEISNMVRFLYPELTDDPKVKNYPNIKGVDKNVFFMHHEELEQEDEGLSSKLNKFEAELIINYANYLIQQNYQPNQITILSLYQAQSFYIKKQIRQNYLDITHPLNRIKIITVDNFQGEENDIIILSLVRSNSKNNIGYLKVSNRVCVALSRAKHGFYIFGNSFCLLNQKLEEQDNLWKKVLKYLKENDFYGNELKLCCNNHKKYTEIKQGSDFQNVPEGGCLDNCDSRLPCGHKCERLCHNFEVNEINKTGHDNDKCLKPCQRVNPCGHECNYKCFECKNILSDCKVKVQVKIQKCGHVNQVECFKSKDLQCQNDCQKVKNCGHRCQKKCYYDCSLDKCGVNVSKILPTCKHEVEIKCFISPKEFEQNDGCYIKCGQILECGHPCAEKCGTCQKKFFHGFCDQKCNRTLFCGHICKDNCAKECSACEAKCETKCAHSKCQQKCYYPCKQCIEPCEIGCIHSKCSKKCHEPCDRQICNEPCPLKLKCEHDCIGLCGDICPQVCRICNKDDETFTIFFGLEDEPDSRFVQIDCGHIFESQQLDRWVNKTEESSDDQEESKQQNNEQNNNSQSSFIKFPECPKCKQLIRKSQRYQNRINQVLNDINVLKSKVESQTENLKKKVEQMQDTYKQFHQKKLECDNKFIQEIQTLLSQWFSMFNQFKQNPVVLQNLERKLILIQIFISCQKYLSQQGWGMVSQNLTLQMQCNEFLRVIKKNKFIIDDNEFESYKKLAEQIDQSIDFKQLVKQLGEAIGISGGRWFKCKNGHFYAIGECGGAMEESRCPECKEVIGGKDHQLAEGNQFASEIDSESRPAWDPQGFNQRVLNGQIDLRQIIHD